MKKAIVYYSKTGNTASVAKRLTGFDLLEIKAKSDDPNEKDPVLTTIPSLNGYDYIVFASPVHGFQLCRIMKAYISQLGTLSGKTIDLFVTHLFRFAFLGGNQALKQLENLVEDKEGSVRYKTSVNWKSKKKEEVIRNMTREYQ